MLKSGKGGAIYRTNLATPNGLMTTNTPLQDLIEAAYEVQGDRIAGAPDWFHTELFDVDAKVGSSTADKLQKLSPDQRAFARRRMLQALLADRFRLAVHRETRELPVYALLIAERGPKLREATPGNTYADGVKGPDGAPLGAGKMTFGPVASSMLKVTAQALPIPSLVRTLSLQVGRTVLDMTGLTGNYDFTLQWFPGSPKDADKSPATGSSIFQAVQQQLGLKLEPKTAPLEMLVVDQAELPSASHSADTTSTGPTYASVSITLNKLGSDRLPLIMFGPDGFSFKNASLQEVIRLAYGVEDDRIIGAPAWLASDKYDFEAKENSSDADDPRKLSVDRRVSEQGRMLQAVLADRLKLVLHRETRDLGVLSLVLAKGGPKLQESKPGDTYPYGFKGPDGVARPGGIHFAGNNKLIAQGVPITTLQVQLSSQLRRTILDETGLSGTYDFTLQLPDSIPLGIDNPTPPQSYEPALTTAIEQQLGLKLEPRKASMEVLIIEHVERPAEN